MPSQIHPLRNLQDERLIPALLRGEVAQGSDKGFRAQFALVALLLLREELATEIIRELINLFDPFKRNVVIKKDWAKRQFRLDDVKIAIHIYRFMQAHGPGTWNIAVELAAKQLGASKGSVRRAWGRHKTHIKRLHDATPDQYQGWDLKLKGLKNRPKIET